MSKTLSFTYGEKTLEVPFPEDFLMGDLVQPKPSQNILNHDQMIVRIDEALANPTGSPRLKDMVADKRVGLVISDEFRAGLQELIAERMLLEIQSGNPKSIDIFLATGSHDAGIYGKNFIPSINAMAKQMGLKNYRVLANNCDSGEHSYLGNTDLGSPAELWDEWLKTEVRVYGHESKHHYMNGFSVVDKQVSPGLASRRTIAATHKQALQHQLAGAGRIYYHEDETRRENPFSYDNRLVRLLGEQHIIENGELKKVAPLPVFLLDMISTTKSIDWLEAGDADTVCRHMTKAADELAANVLPRAKYVVISPGGPPACNALYGVQNCFDIALKFAIQTGGEALILAPCLGRPDLSEEVSGLAPDLKAKKLFWDNLVKWVSRPLSEWNEWVEQNFQLYLWKTDRVLKLQLEQQVKLYLHCTLPDEKILPGGFQPVHDPAAWVAERAARGDGKCWAIDEGNKLLVLPED